MTGLERALEALRAGRPILLFDAEEREGETDIVFLTHLVDAAAVRRLRKDAGGLICATVPAHLWRPLGLPFLTDVIQAYGGTAPVLRTMVPNDIPYDERSSFGITLNHRETYTGITDRDRALTLGMLGRFLVEMEGHLRETGVEAGPADEPGVWIARFGALFRSPGHVFTLLAAPRLLDERRGHTELATALANLSGFPSATVCEMLSPTGDSATTEEAASYAEREGLVFLRGAEVERGWKERFA